MLHFGKER
jgi:hypothetical protein